MKNFNIVLDIGFGDAGKGKIVDSLCLKAQSECKYPYVVRFSGGHQCGHTVMNEFGKHVHASFPSGTLRGIPGYITEHCVISPMHMKKEYDVLKDKLSANKKNLILTVNPLAMVATPYDVVFGQMREHILNHGSCGLGVGATMTRSHQSPYKLYAIDLTNEWILTKKLEQIKKYYLKQFQVLENDISNKAYGMINELIADFIKESAMLEKYFFESIHWFLATIIISNIDLNSKVTLSAFSEANNILIFEGSQGILLDMNHGIFPHVTYANTTSKNIPETIRKNIEETKTFYVSRTYSTRHGSGPFQTNDIKLKNIHHETNQENEWQGKLQIAYLNFNLVNYALNIDRLYNTSLSQLVFNCADQVDTRVLQCIRHSVGLNVCFLNSPYSQIF
jgi:adenylosuccinate synthase